MEVDRISDLLGNVTDQILSYLPIKDAAKTSVLSSKWRYKWETLPCLVLTDELFPPPKDDQGLPMIDKLVRNIDHLLFLHSGPLLNFKLSYRSLSIPADEIDKWVRHVLRRSLRGFAFKISSLEDYKIPSAVFSCQNISRLDLTTCSLRPPSAFGGFKKLKSLKLCSVTVAQDVLERFVSCSPVLQALSLNGINGLSQLNINAPSLRKLCVEGESFVDIRLKLTTPNLQLYSIFTANCIYATKNAYHGNFGDLIKLLANMPQVRRVWLQGNSMEYFARGNIPRELPVHCCHLYYLSIYINLASHDETSALVCLLRSVPNLQTLEIDIWDYDSVSEVWEADHWDRPFTRLRCIMIGSFNEPKVIMDFVKLMLATTPVLERLVFSVEDLKDDKMKFETVKQLCCFKRLSPIAEVIFK